MPMLAGKVMVMDPKPLNKFDDRMRVHIYMPGSREIPQTTQQVKLLMVSFAKYTRTTPAGAAPPTMAANPMIPKITITHNGKAITGTFLLDTGSACSMISKDVAAKLGVHYSEGSTNHLDKVPDKDQFTLTVGGIGGQHEAAGFYLDGLVVPTIKGQPIAYRRAPVLVSDITVMDPATKKTMTLDGVFGMNLLVASAKVTGGLLPDIDKLTQGPFEVIVIDFKEGIMGVK